MTTAFLSVGRGTGFTFGIAFSSLGTINFWCTYDTPDIPGVKGK
jgi:hypothetical protein